MGCVHSPMIAQIKESDETCHEMEQNEREEEEINDGCKVELDCVDFETKFKPKCVCVFFFWACLSLRHSILGMHSISMNVFYF